MKCSKCNTKMKLEVTEFAEGVSFMYICYNNDCDRNIAHHYTKLGDNICLEVTKDELGVLIAAVLDERARLRKFIDRRQGWGKTVSLMLLANLSTLNRLVVKVGKE